VTPEGTTLYLDAFGVHVELFSASISQWNEYLVAGGQMVGVRFERSDSTVTTRYFHPDHLGSIAVITDEAGAVAERLSYDAWGKRRFPNGADDPSGSITSQTTVGFTGQEELADVGLVPDPRLDHRDRGDGDLRVRLCAVPALGGGHNRGCRRRHHHRQARPRLEGGPDRRGDGVGLQRGRGSDIS
jgi:hypothetical protein